MPLTPNLAAKGLHNLGKPIFRTKTYFHNPVKPQFRTETPFHNLVKPQIQPKTTLHNAVKPRIHSKAIIHGVVKPQNCTKITQPKGEQPNENQQHTPQQYAQRRTFV